MTDTVVTSTYLLYHLKDGEPKPFYVGEALDPAARFKRHTRDAADPLNGKEAYAYLREHSITEFFYEVVPDTTEDELLTDLVTAGHRIYNAKRGNASTLKKKKDVRFAILNRDADERIERKARLHSRQQNLSKSEIIGARILNVLPTVEQLEEAAWYPCAPEHLGVDVARTAERAERCQFGDINLYIAWRKNDREQSLLARNTRTGKEVRQERPLYWQLKDRIAVLKTLVRVMSIDYYWEKPYSVCA